MESAGGVSAPPRRLQLRSRSGAFFGGRPALDHPARRLPRRYAGYRARRQWRGDRRRAGADDRLSDYRGGSRLAAPWRRPGGGRPRTRIRFGERLRPGAGAGPYRPRSAAAWLLQRCRSRRPRRGGRRRRAHAVGCQPYRSEAGVRRLLGISAGRGDLHPSRASQLGRDRTDLEPRRVDRHRLAAARARARRQGRACQHDRADRSAQAGARRFAQVRPGQQAGTALARDVHDRDRWQGRGDRDLREGAGGARRTQGRRRHPGRDRRKGLKSHGLLPKALGARICGCRRAAHRLPRGRDLRCGVDLYRSRQAAQGAAAALNQPRGRAMSEAVVDDIVAVLPPLLQSLEALGFIARHLNPPDFDSVMETAGAPDQALQAARSRLADWPEQFTGVKKSLEAASEAALAAFAGLRAVQQGNGDMIAVFRALRHAARAQEALYPLAVKLPPVSDFFVDPRVREDAALKARLAAPAKENTGVIHDHNEPGSRGGFSLYVPEYYTPDRALPLVMALHGGSRTGRGFLWSWLRDARSR